MCVVLLEISSFGTLILLSFNTNLPLKLLIVIILVVQENKFCLTGIVVSGSLRGGRGEVVSRSTEFCTFSSCPEVKVPSSNRISWNTTSRVHNFFL